MPPTRSVPIHEALNAVMRAVPVVKKEDRNTAQNFSFRGIDAVINAVGPALREFGVIVYPVVQHHEARQVVVGRNQTPMNSVLVRVQYTFVGPDGGSLDTVVVGEAMDSGDKAFSKAMSVAFRTALLQTLGLPTDERDPDADAYERVSHARTKSAADLAREDLLIKVNALGYNPADVAQLYLADVGIALREETDDKKIVHFTERLGTK